MSRSSSRESRSGARHGTTWYLSQEYEEYERETSTDYTLDVEEADSDDVDTEVFVRGYSPLRLDDGGER
jgi:hypothetical protein